MSKEIVKENGLTGENDFQEENIDKATTEKDTDRKCPDCGGVMDYDPATGGLHCPYCDHTENIEVQGTKNEAVREQDFFSAVNTESFNWGAKKKTISCKACGAELIYDALQNSDICPYCGSNQVMEIEDQQTMKPGGVVPFSVTDKQAAESFKTWLKGKWFCPREAKEVAKAGRFKGVYLPYWTFDTDTFSKYTGQYGRTRTVRVDKDKTKTVTDWYDTSGTYKTFINDFPILASKKHDSNMLKGLLPYDTESNKAYEPEFVAGFASERYSIGLKEGWELAKPSIVDLLEKDIANKIENEFSTNLTRNIHVDAKFSNIKYKYLLLPVWNSSFKYKNKVYNFMVNGQTGKVSGKSPISPIRVAIAVIIGIILAVIVANFIWER